jgi:hypothetical protein
MASKFTQVKLRNEAHAQLAQLQKELHSRGLPEKVENQDILSALVLYTNPAQMVGMLTEYWRYTAKIDNNE